MTIGTVIGLDVGSVRIGVAKSIPGTTMAVPVKTVKRQTDGSDLDQILQIILNENAGQVVVGLPRLMSGKLGQAAAMARNYAQMILRQRPELRIYFVDERLSSVHAHRQLREAGVNAKNHRKTIDQVAAVGIIEQALAIMVSGHKELEELIDVETQRDGW